MDLPDYGFVLDTISEVNNIQKTKSKDVVERSMRRIENLIMSAIERNYNKETIDTLIVLFRAAQTIRGK